MNNKILYVYLVLAFSCMDMHAAEITDRDSRTRRYLQPLQVANEDLYQAKIKLQEDIQTNPDISRSGDLDPASFDRLSFHDKNRYSRRRNLVRNYRIAKRLFEERKVIFNYQLDLEQQLEAAGLPQVEQEVPQQEQEVPQQAAPAEQVGWVGTILGLPYNAWNAWWGR